MVCCKRSTKPLVQACRGLMRVWRIPSARQATANSALNSPPPSVSTRSTDQPACRTAGTTTVRRNVATAAAVSSGRIRATPYELAIARGDLPHLADPLELADVEGIETEQFAGTLGLDVTRLPMPQPPEQLPRAL